MADTRRLDPWGASLLAELAEALEEHGKLVFERLAMTDPGKLATWAAAAGRVHHVQPSAPGGLDPERTVQVLDIIEAIKVSMDRS
jgi:hypothetical protein